jgi:hypothetical protein
MVTVQNPKSRATLPYFPVKTTNAVSGFLEFHSDPRPSIVYDSVVQLLFTKNGFPVAVMAFHSSRHIDDIWPTESIISVRRGT